MPLEKETHRLKSRTLVPESELSKKLEELVNNDPNAPYIVDRRQMTLLLRVRSMVSLGGHFPVGVAFLTISMIGSLVFLHSDYAMSHSHRENMWVVGSLFATALIAQIVDLKNKRK